jgi:hypothetical protein
MGEWLFGGGGGVYYGAMGLPKGGVKKVPAGGSSCCVCLCCSNKRLCSQRSVDLGPTAVVPCLKRSCCSTRGARAFLGLALLGRDGKFGMSRKLQVTVWNAWSIEDARVM